ncbi:hypothetical protein [Paracoccus sp. (in: a-proteobacteria)]|uniref:hypothetical protein n=1 Tax=Paracoccus sp. TaxID=267 RepID=UPI0028AC4059|nr:hypothetical protein [Paracoccus sp. (in: a-proteobacteria)]
MYPPAPALPEILRQHAEQAALLWTLYDQAMLDPAANPEMDALRIARLLERLEAHLDGLRIAGAEGLRIAQTHFADYPEAGELFVLRMLQPGAEDLRVATLDLEKVRAYLASRLDQPP